MAKIKSTQLPRPLRHAIDLATAVARERVLEVHERAALDVVQRVGDLIPLERVISIYARLHYLDQEDTAALNQRLLVVLGRDMRPWEPVNDGDDDAEAGVGLLETPRELLTRVLRRMRGRVHPELREWLELQTGRTEMHVLRVHAQHAAGFARTTEGATATSAAVELYQARLKVRPALAEVLYLMVLELLLDPAPRDVETPADPGAERRAQRTPRGGLKVIEDAS